jgi:hypothetical protein
MSGELQWGYEDDGPNCLIGSHGILFVRVAHTPQHNAVEYARKFAAVDELIAVCEEMDRTLTCPSRQLLDSTRRELAPWLPQIRAALKRAQGT